MISLENRAAGSSFLETLAALHQKQETGHQPFKLANNRGEVKQMAGVVHGSSSHR
jgi:hypothetical protein